MYQMHLIVVIVLIGDAAPRAVGNLELVMECCVESDDSSVEFGRHADLLEEASLETASVTNRTRPPL